MKQWYVRLHVFSMLLFMHQLSVLILLYRNEQVSWTSSEQFSNMVVGIYFKPLFTIVYLHHRYAFSRNRQPTIVPIPNSNVAIGRATQMSPTDILRVNLLYRCSMYLFTPYPQQNNFLHVSIAIYIIYLLRKQHSHLIVSSYWQNGVVKTDV